MRVAFVFSVFLLFGDGVVPMPLEHTAVCELIDRTPVCVEKKIKTWRAGTLVRLNKSDRLDCVLTDCSVHKTSDGFLRVETLANESGYSTTAL